MIFPIGRVGLAAVAVLALAGPSTVAAEIYVTQDADGNPVYSDRPADTTTPPIELRQSNIYQSQPIPESRPALDDSGADAEKAVSYELRIMQPADEQAIRAPDGRVVVQVSVEPALETGHRLQLLRNGEPVEGEGSPFNVQTYDRGANVFVARVLEGERELARSEPVTVYLLRRGLLSPAPANPAPNFRPPAAP